MNKAFKFLLWFFAICFLAIAVFDFRFKMEFTLLLHIWIFLAAGIFLIHLITRPAIFNWSAIIILIIAGIYNPFFKLIEHQETWLYIHLATIASLVIIAIKK